jgi:formate C-acetyltransferase
MEATADGRKRGEAFSENQSPVYGADKKGVTALLKSVAKLPLTRTASGGINLTFSNPVTPEMIRAITKGYFDIGGIHTALTVVDRATLEAALANPQAYRTLTVRLFGFSEYFINVAKWQQQEIIERTKL